MKFLPDITNNWLEKKDKWNAMKRTIYASSFSSSLSCLFFPYKYSFPRYLATFSLCIPYYFSIIARATFVSRISCAMLQQKLLLHLLLLLLQMSAGALGVKVYEVKVPQPGIVGQSAKLECLWKTGAKDFYSVRWYMDNEQFYSYIRGNEPEKVNHHLTGINVELDNSDESVVTLSDLTPASEGTYRCELMSEAPKFQTSVASANLTVVNEPEELEIQGVQDRYKTGDTLYATCTARNARPPASLSFYANGKRVLTESDYVTELDVVEGSRHDVYTSTSQLILPLSSQHIPILTIRCRSNVLTLEKETALTTHVEPAGSTMLFFFSTGASWNNPSSQAILMFLIVLLLLL